MALGGKRPGAGRPKGALNKATKDVRAVAQQFTDDAIKTLAAIMRSDEQPAAARVSAAKELLERGHGKSVQPIEHSGELRTARDMTDAELLAIASRAGAADEAEGPEQPSRVH